MNRFLIFNFCLICCSNFVSAQVERGNYIIGGSAGLDHVSNGRRNGVTTVNVNPMYGTFLNDHFLIGANANMNYRFNRRGNTSFKGGPLMRYYFNNMLFVQGDYNFGIPARFYVEHDIYARLGYAYFLNDHVAIEPYVYVGYRDLVYKGGTAPDNIDYGIYFSIQVYLESAMNKALKIRKAKTKQN